MFFSFFKGPEISGSTIVFEGATLPIAYMMFGGIVLEISPRSIEKEL